MLIGISTMLAIKTDMEEFQVQPEEMDAFLGAAQNVARHYSVETTQKTLDWIAFIGIGGQVFGSRAVAISVKVKQRKGPRPKRDNVRHLREVPAASDDFMPQGEAGEGFDG